MILIGKTSIDWPAFLTTAKTALGHSASTILDNNSLKANSLPAFIVALGGLQEATRPNDVLLEPGSILNHVSYSFLSSIPEDTAIELMENTPLAVFGTPVGKNGRLVIITGSLQDWRTAIINCCSDTTTLELRASLDLAMLAFEKEGLSLIWGRYRKQTLPDKTFILVEQ